MFRSLLLLLLVSAGLQGAYSIRYVTSDWAMADGMTVVSFRRLPALLYLH